MPKPSESIEAILNTYEHYQINTGDDTIDLPYSAEEKLSALIQFLDEQHEAEQGKVDRIFQVGQTAQPDTKTNICGCGCTYQYPHSHLVNGQSCKCEKGNLNTNA